MATAMATMGMARIIDEPCSAIIATNMEADSTDASAMTSEGPMRMASDISSGFSG